MCICKCIYINIHLHIYLRTNEFIQVYIYTYIYKYICTYISYIYRERERYIYIYIYIYICIYIYIYIHINTYIYTSSCSRLCYTLAINMKMVCICTRMCKYTIHMFTTGCAPPWYVCTSCQCTRCIHVNVFVLVHVYAHILHVYIYNRICTLWTYTYIIYIQFTCTYV